MSVEEPFTILPLEVISRTIEGNVKELLATHSAVAKQGEPSSAAVPAEWLLPGAAPLRLSLASSSSASNGSAQLVAGSADEKEVVLAGAPTNGSLNQDTLQQIKDILKR